MAIRVIEIGVRVLCRAITYLLYSEFAASHEKAASVTGRKKMFNIIRSYDHFTVLLNGQFYCSADTIQEAEQEIAAYYEEERDDIKTGIPA